MGLRRSPDIPEIREPFVSLLPEVCTLLPHEPLRPVEMPFSAFPEYKDIFMFVCDIRAGRIHTGSHEFVRCVGRLAPMDVGQHAVAHFHKCLNDTGVIGIEPEFVADSSRRIADVNADKTVLGKDPVALFPCAIENAVHFPKSLHPVTAKQSFTDSRVLLTKHSIPHADHGIGWRCDNQVYAACRNHGHIRACADDYFMPGHLLYTFLRINIIMLLFLCEPSYVLIVFAFHAEECQLMFLSVLRFGHKY